jgi:hypothetical protein
MANLIRTLRRLRAIATVRYWASIATLNIETIIYMAAKVSRAVKPRTGTHEDTTHKPFRAVVAVGSAGVRSVVIVTIRASGFVSDLEVILGLYFRSGRREANYGGSSESKTIEFVHESSSHSEFLWQRCHCTSTGLRINSRIRNRHYSGNNE